MSLPIEAVTDLVRDAGRQAMAVRAEGLRIEAKGRQDFVTQADRAVERFLRDRLQALLPGSEFLGEEDGGPPMADRLWIVDPIDGTTNFLRGLPHWCVSVALTEAGRPRFGVIHAPMLDLLYIAETGRGATCNGQPLRRQPVDPERAMINVGQSRHLPSRYFRELVAGLRHHQIDYRLLGSGALGLALTASGEVDGGIEGQVRPWDVAAGLVIAREAGCVVNDYFPGNTQAAALPAIAVAPGVDGVVFDVLEAALDARLPRLYPDAPPGPDPEA